MKAAALDAINGKYPTNEWIKVYIDGSLINNSKDLGAGMYCKELAQYLALDEIANHFDGELTASKLALQIILYRSHIKQKIVILSESKAATEAFANYKNKSI